MNPENHFSLTLSIPSEQIKAMDPSSEVKLVAVSNGISFPVSIPAASIQSAFESSTTGSMEKILLSVVQEPGKSDSASLGEQPKELLENAELKEMPELDRMKFNLVSETVVLKQASQKEDSEELESSFYEIKYFSPNKKRESPVKRVYRTPDPRSPLKAIGRELDSERHSKEREKGDGQMSEQMTQSFENIESQIKDLNQLLTKQEEILKKFEALSAKMGSSSKGETEKGGKILKEVSYFSAEEKKEKSARKAKKALDKTDLIIEKELNEIYESLLHEERLRVQKLLDEKIKETQKEKGAPPPEGKPEPKEDQREKKMEKGEREEKDENTKELGKHERDELAQETLDEIYGKALQNEESEEEKEGENMGKTEGGNEEKKAVEEGAPSKFMIRHESSKEESSEEKSESEEDEDDE